MKKLQKQKTIVHWQNDKPQQRREAKIVNREKMLDALTCPC